MKLIKIHVGPGSEVMDIITQTVKKKKIKEGAIISVIGAVDECYIL